MTETSNPKENIEAEQYLAGVESDEEVVIASPKRSANNELRKQVGKSKATPRGLPGITLGAGWQIDPTAHTSKSPDRRPRQEYAGNSVRGESGLTNPTESLLKSRLASTSHEIDLASYQEDRSKGVRDISVR